MLQLIVIWVLHFLACNKLKIALFQFEHTLTLQPNYGEAFFGIAKIHLSNHLFDKSEATLLQAIQLDNKNIDFYQLLINVYCEQGNLQKALYYSKYILSIDKVSAHVYFK